MSLGVAGMGKEKGEMKEGERETDVDFIFGQGLIRKWLHQKLRIFERLLEKAQFISQCVGGFMLLSSVISGVFWVFLSRSFQRCLPIVC